MTKITNHTRGPRFFNAKSESGKPVRHILAPGQTSPDLELFKPDDRVLMGMHETGQISLDGKRPQVFAERDQLAEARKDHDQRLQELRQKEQELSVKEAELNARFDKLAQLNREAAELAGAVNADPLPPGTDTEGGPEAEEARKRAGVDQDQAKKGQGIQQEIKRPAEARQHEAQRRPQQAPHQGQERGHERGQERPKG